jgi:hypothetical protein
MSSFLAEGGALIKWDVQALRRSGTGGVRVSQTNDLRGAWVVAWPAVPASTGTTTPGPEPEIETPEQPVNPELPIEPTDPDPSIQSTTVKLITFNWPQRYTSGGEKADEDLIEYLKARASIFGFQEAAWLNPKILDGENLGIYNPDPAGDSESGKAGQVLCWRLDTWSLIKQGTWLLNKPTEIQPPAAGPTVHAAKSVIWSELRNLETRANWTFGVVHFVPSKHLGGAALDLWKQQRDNLLKWWEKQGPRTVVLGDFNAKPTDSVCDPILKVARLQQGNTFGERDIDWVMRKPQLKAVSQAVLSNKSQSDHKPMLGVVRD